MGDLDILSEDGGLAFCRGWRDSTESGGSGVLVVLPTSVQPTANVDRLAHGYSFRDELDSTWAVRPIELVRDRGQSILVLEDPGGDLLGSLLGAPMEVGFRIAVGIAATLGQVHRRGLIHKDIKPANILVNLANNEVRLTLFAAGKFDQYERDIPYATLAQAFQTLIRQILVKSEAEVGHWRRALPEALGAHGQLIVNLVPELESSSGNSQPFPTCRRKKRRIDLNWYSDAFSNG
jgi:serine/threonine protein kinase